MVQATSALDAESEGMVQEASVETCHSKKV